MIRLFNTPNFIRYIVPNRIWRVSSNNCVYLTFDDGPTEDLTKWIVDFLKTEQVKATFFLVGENVKRNPQLLDLLKSEGHAIGNHTMRHERATKVSLGTYLESIEEASEHIDSKLFRPPYGRLPLFYGAKVAKDYKIVMWSWLSYDFDSSVQVSHILEKAKRQIKSGDVLVVHDNLKTEDRIKELLPQLVALIKDKGLQFDVISA